MLRYHFLSARQTFLPRQYSHSYVTGGDVNRCYYRIFLFVLATALGAIPIASVSTPTQSPSPAATTPAKVMPTNGPVPANAILVPGGTTVVVSLTEPVSSSTANENDQIALVVKRDVLVNGQVVVAAGANGHATITSVAHAGSNGSGGKIAMSVDWVYSVDGGKVALSQTNHASENGDNKGAASTATLLSWALLGPLGFFAHNFVRGHDVSIGTDKSFTVFVDHDVHVVPTQKTAASAGFDH
jgi:hypothetical protein